MLKDFTRLLIATTILIVSAVLSYAAYLIIEWFKQPRTIEQIEAAQWRSTFIRWSLVTVAVFLGLVITFHTFIWLRKRWRESKYIYPGQDGSLPIVPTKYVGRDQYGHRVVYQTYHDLEKAVDPTTVFSMNGSVRVDSYASGDPATQQQIAQRVTDKRHNSAMLLQQQKTAFLNGARPTGGKGRGRGPNRAELEHAAGVNDAKRRHYELKNQLIESRLNSQQQATKEADEDAPIITPMTLSEACRLSGKNSVVLGRNQTTALPVFWEFQHLSHLRIHGATNGGKSTMLRAICVQLVQKQHGLIFLDNSSLVDFRIFENVAQLVDCKDSNLLLAALRKIWAEVEAREQLIIDTVAVDDDGKYENIPENIRPKRFFVILDEYADHVAEAVGVGLADEITALVDRLAAKARKTGIHLVFGDQKPTSEAWTTRLKENAQAVLCSKMSKAVAASVYGQPLPDITGKHVFAFNNGDKLVKAPFEPDFIKAMIKHNAHKTMPVFIDLESDQRVADAVKEVAADSPKVQKCLDFLTTAPDATLPQIQAACNVGRTTANTARRLFKQQMQRD